MKQKFEMRVCFRFTSNGWRRCKFSDLVPLDNFHLYQNGEKVVGRMNTGDFVATSLPYINKKGQPAIQCEELKK
jgi:hypothetical protein